MFWDKALYFGASNSSLLKRTCLHKYVCIYIYTQRADFLRVERVCVCIFEHKIDVPSPLKDVQRFAKTSVPTVLSFRVTGHLSLSLCSAINWHVDITYLLPLTPHPPFVWGPCQHSVPLRGRPVNYVDLLQSFSKNWSTEV